MGVCAAATIDDPQAAVVLVDCAGGSELAVVHRTLTQALRIPSIYIGRDDLSSLAISFDPTTGLVDIDDCRVRPAVAWVRHASVGAILAHARPAGIVGLPDAALWSGAFEQLAASTVSLPGSTPGGLGQLRDAARLGVRVPHTLATTDVAGGAGRIRSRKVVVKIQDSRLFEVRPEEWPALLPAILDRETATRDRPLTRSSPVVVQEYVSHVRELRVYHLNGGFCAFEVRKPTPSSIWSEPDRVTVTPIDCPPNAANVVRTLCAAWNLRYGAFDLLESPTGDLVFLEANRDGDWRWYERRSRWSGVSFMAAVMVHDLYVRHILEGSRR